ncbi:MAG: zinc ribbon domain-containing protein [Candidatus Methanomethylophilus sp.]|nr:zinc ribbon domain-containing protein [Methanomethylophilus sp.]MDD3232859.1 zinc ribbon domain-containing protein [Methanomethylophilus sp.]MDD4221600.1 zinc ribbon domain-containing protein [Methanomethylophilus sp.]MDD4668830.1 zinc ribbon domain-containing protein [Methanomethylophilus sp.]
MKDESGIRYCDECGNELAPGDAFCTYCGAYYREKVPAGTGNQSLPPQAPSDKMPLGPAVGYGAARIPVSEIFKSALTMAKIMLWIWAGFILIDSTVSLFFPDTVMSVYEQYFDSASSIGFSSWEAYREALVFSGSIGLISGIAAIVSGLLCNRQRHWKAAVVFCAVASLVMLGLLVFGDYTGLFMTLCGASVTLLVYRCRSVFTD